MNNETQSYGGIIWRQFRASRLAFASLIFAVFMILIAVFAPVIANDRPLLMKFGGKWYAPALSVSKDLRDIDLSNIRNESALTFAIMPPITYRPGTYDLNAVLSPPSSKHVLGTDGDGRDTAAQLIWGARISLSVGIVAVGITVIIGIFFGSLAGFYGGAVDILISRLIEVILCFPTFFLILAVLAFVGPSIYNIMIVIGFVGWTGVARLVRADFLRLKKRDFVVAAVVSGSSDARIMLRHILPHAMAPVLVSASFGVAGAILFEAALSFLGFGVPPSTPSWGSMLSAAQSYMDTAWWLTIVPGSAIFLVIMAYNLIGEGLRDAVDPNLKA